jgi:S1-C subfamily serine protease
VNPHPKVSDKVSLVAQSWLSSTSNMTMLGKQWTISMGLPSQVGLALLLVGLSGIVQSRDLDVLNAQTVKIVSQLNSATKISNATPLAEEEGSGFVICKNENVAFIATAKHVVRFDDETYSSVSDSMPPKQDMKQDIQIRMYGRASPIYGTPQSFEVWWPRYKDIALLKIADPPGGMQPVTIGKSESLALLEDKVLTIGYSATSMKDWLPAEGPFKALDEFLYYSASVGSGYSGGPVFDRHDTLVGMNIESGQPPEYLVRAIPVEEVVSVVRERVSRYCTLRFADIPMFAPPAKALSGAGQMLPTGRYAIVRAGGFDEPIHSASLNFVRTGNTGKVLLEMATPSGGYTYLAKIAIFGNEVHGIVTQTNDPSSANLQFIATVTRDGELYTWRDNAGRTMILRRER